MEKRAQVVAASKHPESGGMFTLRDYQAGALDAVETAWASGTTRPAVVLPTGAGKTVIFAHLIRRAYQRGERSLVLVHRNELVRQAVAKLHAVIPDVEVGVVKAAENDVGAQVIVASVQTLARKARREALRSVQLVVVDEAHHAAADSYMAVLEHVGSFDGVPTVGFTATLDRQDSRKLGDVWQEVVYRKSILHGIAAGYLVDVKGVQVFIDELGLDDVDRARGDYQDDSLGKALVGAGAGPLIAEAYVEHASDRPGVVFSPTVATAYTFAEDLRQAGISAEVIEGDTSLEDRALIYKRYEAGEVQVLSTCMVLSEGWDSPQTSCAVIARPTTNASLYTQMAGRILRPFPGKDHALLLDVVGASSRYALTTIANLAGKNPIEMKEGETLAGAAQRDEEAVAAGKLSSQSVDLFRSSKAMWLRTRKGLFFIPTFQETFAIVPQADGLYAVASFARHKPGVALGTGLPLDYAMSVAEQAAMDKDPSIASRGAPWRKRKALPSQPQMDLARRLGLPGIERMTKAEMSDELSIFFASRLLDKYAKAA